MPPTAGLTVTLPPDVAARVRAAAEVAERSPDEVVAEACRAHLPTEADEAREDQYQRGYERVPEDTSEVESLLSIAPVPPEDWS
jgi:hypothetical protein